MFLRAACHHARMSDNVVMLDGISYSVEPTEDAEEGPAFKILEVGDDEAEVGAFYVVIDSESHERCPVPVAGSVDWLLNDGAIVEIGAQWLLQNPTTTTGRPDQT